MALRLLALAAFTALNVSARSVLSPRQLVPPPSQDPFYDPPTGYAKEPPGTVLRNRTIVAAFLGLVPDPVEAYQLLYRTTAINGTPIAGVTTIFKPLGAATDRFVSFQTAYDSSATKCDPSYTYALGDPQNDFITSFEQLILQAYLGSGYIVSSPDYEGPDAAFSPGHLEGMGVLDSMRAVQNFGSVLGLTTSKPKIVGVGYSGGAIATGWAASLQRTYAKSLNVVGWAAGGTPANLTSTQLFLDGALFSGFLPPALVGQMAPSAYGAQLRPVIERIITPYGQSKLDYAAQNCATNDIMNYAFQSTLSTKFQKLGAGILTNPTFVKVFDQNIMGIHQNQAPIPPVYMYHASQDEIIPYPSASLLATNWCNYGSSVAFTTFAAGGHLTTELLGVPSVVSFVKSAFAGTVAKGCSRNTVLSNTLDPLALGANLEPIAVKLITALATAGPNDTNIINNLSILKQSV